MLFSLLNQGTFLFPILFCLNFDILPWKVFAPVSIYSAVLILHLSLWILLLLLYLTLWMFSKNMSLALCSFFLSLLYTLNKILTLVAFLFLLVLKLNHISFPDPSCMSTSSALSCFYLQVYMSKTKINIYSNKKMPRHKHKCTKWKRKMTNKHKMFKITSYQKNANQNKKGIPFTPIKLSNTI